MGEGIGYTISEGLAIVTLDAPEGKVNILRGDVLRALEETARRLENEPVRGAVLLSAKSAGFVAGADIEAIAAVTDSGAGAAFAREGQRILGLWSRLPFPVVAALHGHALGGGAELALACPFRIARADAAIGFPEVRLGIIPGFGGTQRLPRLIGISAALDLILTGRTVRAEEALRLGLVDRLCEGDLLNDALAFLKSIPSHPTQKRRGGGGWKSLLLERTPLGRKILFARAHQRTVEKTQGNYPAPLRAIEVIRRGMTLPLPEGLELEAQAIGDLIATETSKNLIHVYRLSQRSKKLPADVPPLPIRRSAVLGAGIMGRGIAHFLASHDLPVALKDIRQEVVEAALTEIRQALGRESSRQRTESFATRQNLLTGAIDDKELGKIDLVIEAVAENLSVKKQVLRDIEPHLSPEAVFATNTSALSVSDLQEEAQHPGRVGGLHFFNPVHRMPLVEIVRGDSTDDRTVATLLHLSVKFGKTPIVVRDSPGFLVNRLLVTYLNEASLLAEEGVEWLSLDALAKRFGWPMGPFRLLDEIGIDIAAEVGLTLGKALPHVTPSPLLFRAAEAGLTGKKGGNGFYRYRDGHSAGASPGVDGKLGLERKRKGEEIDLKRMMYLMVNEASRCLEERVVPEPEDIDAGMIFGTGFPPFRGGLCRWADGEGLPRIRQYLEDLSRKGGDRFSPRGILAERQSFYRLS